MSCRCWCVLVAVRALDAARWCARRAASPRRAGQSWVSPAAGTGCARGGTSTASAAPLGAAAGAISASKSSARLEGAVDAGEPQVGHLVELAQRRRGWPCPTSWAGTSAQPLAAQRVLDLLAEAGQVVLGDRPALAGLADAGDRLVAGERLGRAGPLHHHELHLLDGAEPLAALRAGAPPADRAAVVGDPAVEDPGVGVAAVRTVHVAAPFARCSCLYWNTQTPPVSAPAGDPAVGETVDDVGTTGRSLCRTDHYLWRTTRV